MPLEVVLFVVAAAMARIAVSQLSVNSYIKARAEKGMPDNFI